MQEEGKMTDNDLTSLPAPEWRAEARIPLDDAGTPAS